MAKTLWFTLFSSIGTIILLYVIGSIFNISALEFNLFLNEPLKNGLIVDADIALLPIIIGLVVGFIVERTIKTRKKQIY
jgi:hypothetical protein